MVKKSDIQTLLEDGPEQAAQLPERREMDRAPLVRPAGHARRRDDGQFEVVWSGIGPLPGAGAPPVSDRRSRAFASPSANADSIDPRPSFSPNAAP